MNYEDMLYRLSKSKFRSSFKLKTKDIDYIKCGTYQNKLSTKDNVQYGIKLATSNQMLYRLFKGD